MADALTALYKASDNFSEAIANYAAAVYRALDLDDEALSQPEALAEAIDFQGSATAALANFSDAVEYCARALAKDKGLPKARVALARARYTLTYCNNIFARVQGKQDRAKDLADL
jgi:2-hydroxychromene-2-carboxylate isomerase